MTPTDEARVRAIARVIMTAWGWSKPAFDDPIHALTRRNAERVARSIIAADPLTQEHAQLKADVVELLTEARPYLEPGCWVGVAVISKIDALLDRINGGVK